MAEIPTVARALLETIAGPESAGDYNVIYGGTRFDDYSDHPRQYITITSGPNEGKKSSAAGKYQFIGSTWDDQAQKLGLTDFSPASQDAAAWNLAQEEYRRDTGRDLLADLEAGNLSQVAPSLKNQWTSMPGGIEQGITGSAFSKAYQDALAAAGANPIMAYNNTGQLPKIGPTGGPAMNAINNMVGMVDSGGRGVPPQQAPGLWSVILGPLKNVMPQGVNVPGAARQLAASPQVQQAMIGPLMGSLAGRTAIGRHLMNQNIGAAPTVTQGHVGPGTRAIAVNQQGATPVTLTAAQRLLGGTSSPASQAHGGMNMDVYRANRDSIGSPITSTSIASALSSGRDLYRLA